VNVNVPRWDVAIPDPHPADVPRGRRVYPEICVLTCLSANLRNHAAYVIRNPSAIAVAEEMTIYLVTTEYTTS
jgi:hypothetical protein